MNISILIPLLPMAATLFILILLISFNRTINRLTKPVSAIIGLSLLSSALISSFYLLKKIEGEIVLSRFFKILEETNLVIHLNLFSERVLVFVSSIMSVLVAILFYKLPRRKGYVSLLVGLGLISSSIMFSILLVDPKFIS